MTVSGIDSVVFDVGGVLLDWNPRNIYRRVLPTTTRSLRPLADAPREEVEGTPG